MARFFSRSFLPSLASSLLIAPSATAIIVNLLPFCSLFLIASTTLSMSYGISGIRMMSAPPAIPALRVRYPTLCPITSTMKMRPWLDAVVWIQSMQSVAILTALWKPKVISVPYRSLSIVLGSVITLRPSSLKRLAVLCVPLPPKITRQSSLSL